MTAGPTGGWDQDDDPLPNRGSSRRRSSAAVVDRFDERWGFGPAVGVGGPARSDRPESSEDVLIQDLVLDHDGDPDAGGGSDAGATTLRLLKVVAVVGVAGWAIALLANLLGPSNLLDTTNRESEEPLGLDQDLEAGLGGGAQVAGDGGETADVLRVGEAQGPVVAGGDPGAVDGEEVASPTVAATGDAATAAAAASAGVGSGDYQSNLELLRSASLRNRNHDASSYRGVAQSDLVPTDHYGPRADYLLRPGGNPERSFPVPTGGQFRASCEFSHFGYDDPLVFPGQPGASHLHMFFGNTDVNAFTTHDSLINSGSSTCNGQELNRTGYWVPAMFDGAGNVRVPERIVIYYKGEGKARGSSEVYPAGAAFVTSDNLNTLPSSEGGIGGKKLTFLCTDNFSTNTNNGSQELPNCDGSTYVGAGKWTVLEVNVKFPQCWNGQDPADWNNFAPPTGDWYGSVCGGEFGRTLPNMEYFVNYQVEAGENTADWFLSSDVDPTSFGTAKGRPGATSHGDWWGGWHPEVNRMWIDNCVNYRATVASGCGKGYLTDGGPNGNAPLDGPALRIRPEYQGPTKIAASTLFQELCPGAGREFRRAEDAAYCTPG